MSKFSDWNLAKLDKRFGLGQVRHLPALDEWLAAPIHIHENERASLLNMQEYLIDNVLNWNEQELSLHFIGPLFSHVRISGKNFNAFAGRSFVANVEGEDMNGTPDGMIASGEREPEHPYFCFQEYKKDTNPDGDPAGQCLAAMLAAQSINNDGLPVYGCYVVGRNWYFMAILGKQYAISNGHNATDEELFDITGFLYRLKELVIQRVSNYPN